MCVCVSVTLTRLDQLARLVGVVWLALLNGRLDEILGKQVAYEVHDGVLGGGGALCGALADARLGLLVARLDAHDQYDAEYGGEQSRDNVVDDRVEANLARALRVQHGHAGNERWGDERQDEHLEHAHEQVARKRDEHDALAGQIHRPQQEAEQHADHDAEECEQEERVLFQVFGKRSAAAHDAAAEAAVAVRGRRGRGRRLGRGGGCYGARLFLLAAARRLGRRIRLILVGCCCWIHL